MNSERFKCTLECRVPYSVFIVLERIGAVSLAISEHCVAKDIEQSIVSVYGGAGMAGGVEFGVWGHTEAARRDIALGKTIGREGRIGHSVQVDRPVAIRQQRLQVTSNDDTSDEVSSNGCNRTHAAAPCVRVLCDGARLCTVRLFSMANEVHSVNTASHTDRQGSTTGRREREIVSAVRERGRVRAPYRRG
jgi:hypothetical protein